MEATTVLVKESLVVLPYAGNDPAICRKLNDAGAASTAVMPLGGPIGSGLWIRTRRTSGSSRGSR